MHPMVERIDGLLLPGGIDLDPAWYNEAPAAGLEEVNRDLDIFQFSFSRCAAGWKNRFSESAGVASS